MKKNFSKIAIIDVVNITNEAKTEIQSLSKAEVLFPKVNAIDEDEVIKRIAQADAVLGSYNSTITKKVLNACPTIKYIGICGTNMSNLDLNEIERKGITIKNVTDYGDEGTAEYIFAQLLMLVRGFGLCQWKSEPCELNGKTIGLIGMGAVGQQVVRLGLGFNMKTLYHSRTRKLELERSGLEFCSLEHLLRSSDIISLHVPKNLVVLQDKEFALIKPGAILVDTCLGVVFDIDSFLSWIAINGNFAVFDYKEELVEKIKHLKNVVGATSGVAGITLEARGRLGRKVLDNIKNYLSKN